MSAQLRDIRIVSCIQQMLRFAFSVFSAHPVISWTVKIKSGS